MQLTEIDQAGASRPRRDTRHLEEEIDSLLESLGKDAVDSAPPEMDGVAILWGRTDGGIPYIGLEERVVFLAEAWEAMHRHQTWGELEVLPTSVD